MRPLPRAGDRFPAVRNLRRRARVLSMPMKRLQHSGNSSGVSASSKRSSSRIPCYALQPANLYLEFSHRCRPLLILNVRAAMRTRLQQRPRPSVQNARHNRRARSLLMRLRTSQREGSERGYCKGCRMAVGGHVAVSFGVQVRSGSALGDCWTPDAEEQSLACGRYLVKRAPIQREHSRRADWRWQ